MQESNLFKVSEFELHYNPEYQKLDRPVVTDAVMAEKIFRDNWRKGTIGFQESFYAMFLDNSKQVMGLAEISKGGSNATIVDPKLIFAFGLKVATQSMILAHNHPSGSLKASTADINLTRRLIEAGKFLKISIDDHLILTPQSYTSIRKECLCPFISLGLF